MKAKVPPEERFWSKVNIAGPDECWDWQAATNPPHRYGKFWLGGKNERAHRVAWLFTNGEIPSGLCALHKCDNPLCVNPNHLFLGTFKDNAQDRARKDRNRKQNGELGSTSKLTTVQVLEIRRLYALGDIPQGKLARMFNVARGHVSNIIRRKRWAHLP